jgi:acetyl esterase/lipase
MKQLTVSFPDDLFYYLQQRVQDEQTTSDFLLQAAVRAFLTQNSAHTRLRNSGIHIYTDIPYLTPDRSEKCDVYLPVTPRAQRPSMILFHGGSWSKGDKSSQQLIDLIAILVQAGIACISVNYLLASEGSASWPQCLYDCKNSVRYVRSHAHIYNIDPNNIFLYGGSWGGYLASLTCSTGDQLFDMDSPYVNISSDIRGLITSGAVFDPFSYIKPEKLSILFGVKSNQVEDYYEEATPISHITSNHPPMLILNGENENSEIIRQSSMYRDRLKEEGIEHVYTQIENESHLISRSTLANYIIQFIELIQEQTNN